MLMAIDVGNTNITIGFYDGDDLVATKRASTAERRTSDEIAVLLYAFMDLAQILPDQIDAVIVSSVVPKIMHSLKNAIVKYEIGMFHIINCVEFKYFDEFVYIGFFDFSKTSLSNGIVQRI